MKSLTNKHLLKVIALVLLFTFFTIIFRGQALAEDDFDGGVDWNSLISTSMPKLEGLSMGGIINVLMPYVYAAASFLLLLYLVLGGYQVLVSRGDPKAIAMGREKITYAIVGFIIMFAAYWIVKLVGEILDIQQIRDLFP